MGAASTTISPSAGENPLVGASGAWFTSDEKACTTPMSVATTSRPFVKIGDERVGALRLADQTCRPPRSKTCTVGTMLDATATSDEVSVANETGVGETPSSGMSLLVGASRWPISCCQATLAVLGSTATTYSR